MSELPSYKFYCLSYYEKKREIMKKQFNKLNIDCTFYSGVDHNNEKINIKKYNKFKKRQLSMMYGHLNIFKDFYNDKNTKYAIICEDDIIIHNDIKKILNKVIIDFNLLDLDLLLLSFMIPYKIESNNLSIFPPKIDMPSNSCYKYYNYPYYLFGTQMYMIRKEYAKYILDQHYFTNYSKMLCFSLDNILIHSGNKALIYPMLAIENEEQEDPYHQLCHKIHFDNFFI
jgi:GR25 family glycosyltransferase involved in LPS biosynthesis